MFLFSFSSFSVHFLSGIRWRSSVFIHSGIRKSSSKMSIDINAIGAQKVKSVANGEVTVHTNLLFAIFCCFFHSVDLILRFRWLDWAIVIDFSSLCASYDSYKRILGLRNRPDNFEMFVPTNCGMHY